MGGAGPERRGSREGPGQRGGGHGRGQARGEGVTAGAGPEGTGREFQAPGDSSSSRLPRQQGWASKRKDAHAPAFTAVLLTAARHGDSPSVWTEEWRETWPVRQQNIAQP